MAMYSFISPDVELDERILSQIWRHAHRLSRFYTKWSPPAELLGPHEFNGVGIPRPGPSSRFVNMRPGPFSAGVCTEAAAIPGPMVSVSNYG